MITDAQKAELKGKLEKEKTLLEEELSHLGARNPSNPSDWVAVKPEGDEFGADRTDNAGVIEDMHTRNASMNELEGRLNNVQRALDKFATGTYGICEMANTEIEIERLTANPAARTCKAHMSEEHTLP